MMTLISQKKPIGFFFLLLSLVLFLGPSLLSKGEKNLLTEKEKKWLQANYQKLPLYFNTEFPPIEFSSPQGKFIGMGADIFSAVEKKLGFVFPKKACPDWNRHLAVLESGSCAIAPTIVRTPSREKYAFFTSPYAKVPVVIISRKDLGPNLKLTDLAGKKVAVVSGYATEKYVRRRSRGRFTIVTVKNVTDGLRMAAFGQADALVENLAVAAYYIEKEGIPSLHVAGSTDYFFDWRIGVSKKYPLLYSSLNKALNAVGDAEKNRIRKQWISLEVKKGISPEHVNLINLIALFALFLVTGLAIISFLLKRRLNEKMTSLMTAREKLLEQTAKLALSEERFRRLFERAPLPMVELNKNGIIVMLNDKFTLITGYTIEDIPTIDHWWGLACPDKAYREHVKSAWEKEIDAAINRNTDLIQEEYLITTKTGTQIHMLISASIIGENLLISFVDITARKKAEKEREKLQGQLLQSQKLEAVGILAGGIAHDFNNLLGGIMGYTQITLKKMAPGDPLKKNLEKIMDASQRSANLIKQLLAFARKQAAQPVFIDINSSLKGMLKMLERIIGENIELIWIEGELSGNIKIDPSQLDQILTNLCINARDAITDVGKLFIETGEAIIDEKFSRHKNGLIPGEYITLTISDNGAGMDEETMKHIFEPFYTTKTMGKGTGLGLATVYGIVKQNDGFIDIYSEKGHGSSFKLYFPLHRAEADSAYFDEHAEVLKATGEKILIVEDDPLLLETSIIITKDLGYEVFSAADPEEALTMVEKEKIYADLVITDVIMPGMNGRVLAEKLKEITPGAKFLFISGYLAVR